MNIAYKNKVVRVDLELLIISIKASKDEGLKIESRVDDEVFIMSFFPNELLNILNNIT